MPVAVEFDPRSEAFFTRLKADPSRCLNLVALAFVTLFSVFYDGLTNFPGTSKNLDVLASLQTLLPVADGVWLLLYFAPLLIAAVGTAGLEAFSRRGAVSLTHATSVAAAKEKHFALAGPDARRKGAWEARPVRCFGTTIHSGDLAFAIALVLLNCIWFFVRIGHFFTQFNSLINNPKNPRGAVFVYGFLANAFAMPAIWMMAICVILVFRKSIFNSIGVSYESGLPFHIWSGYVSLAYLTLHTGLWFVFFIIRNGVVTGILPTTLTGFRNFPGLVGWFALVLMTISSLPYFRRRYYEFFLISHQALCAVFFIGTIIHWFPAVFFLMPAAVGFVADRVACQIIRLRRHHNPTARIVAVSRDLVRVEVFGRALNAGSVEGNHATAESGGSFGAKAGMSTSLVAPLPRYAPGDWAQLTFPGVSVTEKHAFTIGSYWPETPDRMVFYVKAKGAWTSRLHEIAAAGGPVPSRLAEVEVQGPFAPASCTYAKYPCLVLVAAGTGFVPFMPLLRHFASIIRSRALPAINPGAASAVTEPVPERVVIHWILRDGSDLLPYKEYILEKFVADPVIKNLVEMHVHITRGSPAGGTADNAKPAIGKTDSTPSVNTLTSNSNTSSETEGDSMTESRDESSEDGVDTERDGSNGDSHAEHSSSISNEVAMAEVKRDGTANALTMTSDVQGGYSHGSDSFSGSRQSRDRTATRVFLVYFLSYFGGLFGFLLGRGIVQFIFPTALGPWESHDCIKARDHAVKTWGIGSWVGCEFTYSLFPTLLCLLFSIAGAYSVVLPLCRGSSSAALTKPEAASAGGSRVDGAATQQEELSASQDLLLSLSQAGDLVRVHLPAGGKPCRPNLLEVLSVEARGRSGPIAVVASGPEHLVNQTKKICAKISGEQKKEREIEFGAKLHFFRGSWEP